MYDYIKGPLEELTPACAVVEAGGVGYLLNISLQTYSEIEGHGEAKLYTHYIVREDAQILYGFATREEREIFRLLISVSGVGGTSARMILSTYSPSELASIISSENATLLKNVKGLGLKTAQKIIVELREKIAGTGASTGAAGLSGVADAGRYDAAIAALAMLGFTRGASDKAVRAVCKELPTASVEEIIRTALKRL
ncbi:MAG: Holliday junction branch migration protein RuvA [Rikenellaceae bacterium]|jgi:Holliday junction DNA helicase RuvA|nr:Holliday junction branch migration protein RuvA [Rikenellaceae bacterium]